MLVRKRFEAKDFLILTIILILLGSELIFLLVSKELRPEKQRILSSQNPLRIIMLWVACVSFLAKTVAPSWLVCVPGTNLVAMGSFTWENICHLQVVGTPDRLTDLSVNISNSLAGYRERTGRKT